MYRDLMIMEKLKYHKNCQNLTQRQEVNKMLSEKCRHETCSTQVVRNLPYVSMKHSKTRSACTVDQENLLQVRQRGKNGHIQTVRIQDGFVLPKTNTGIQKTLK